MRVKAVVITVFVSLVIAALVITTVVVKSRKTVVPDPLGTDPIASKNESGYAKRNPSAAPSAKLPNFKVINPVEDYSPSRLHKTDSQINAGTLIPPLESNAAWGEAQLLKFYFGQLGVSGTPKVSDWGRLISKHPRGLEKYWEVPVGVDRFVTSACIDSLGTIWLGTEGQGVWSYKLNASLESQWKHYTIVEGLGDNFAYALAVDGRGRIWVGHLNHGISVFNGSKWQNYQQLVAQPGGTSLVGPIGERVYNIKLCPSTGDMWIASNAGLNRYADVGTWKFYSKIAGINVSEVSGLAFNTKGTMFVATSCNGLLIAESENDYELGHHVDGPNELPLVPQGEGLPGNQMNAVLTTPSSVIVATTQGLGWSNDDGVTWKYSLGADWQAKVKGRAQGRPSKWRPAHAHVIPECYVTTLGLAADETILLGFREKGYSVIGAPSDDGLDAGDSIFSEGYVTCIACEHSCPYTVIGTYGDGIFVTGEVANSNISATSEQVVVPFPAEATVPLEGDGVGDLSAFVRNTAAKDEVRSIASDWMTSGDWRGRYGKYWALFAGMLWPKDLEWGPARGAVPYVIQLGKKHRHGDLVRRWMSQAYTNDSRSLELPTPFAESFISQNFTTRDKLRRQAEWDDHGEIYAKTVDAPGIYCNIDVPPGIFIASIYFENDDAHSRLGQNQNRYRDYLILVKSQSKDADRTTPEDVDSAPELARARVRYFFGGVYCRVLVQGPKHIGIVISKNGSFNTCADALFLDRVDEFPQPYYGDQDWSALLSTPAGAVEPSLPRSGPISASALERIQPYAYAALDEGVYARLARRELKLKQFGPDLSSCCYALHDFARWEAALAQMRITSAREVEEHLPWLGQPDDAVIDCADLISSYRKAHLMKQ